jgi:predicted RNase H-like nuclease (RuvC/YqgF family)
VFEEQKETLKKERGEHMTVVEKLQKAEQELKRLSREFDALDKRCEELQFHNHTLVDDKKQLQQTLDQMKAGGAKVDAGGGLERELRELQDSLHQKVRHGLVYTVEPPMYKDTSELRAPLSLSI